MGQEIILVGVQIVPINWHQSIPVGHQNVYLIHPIRLTFWRSEYIVSLGGFVHIIYDLVQEDDMKSQRFSITG